jgi:hypothetical protein
MVAAQSTQRDGRPVRTGLPPRHSRIVSPFIKKEDAVQNRAARSFRRRRAPLVALTFLALSAVLGAILPTAAAASHPPLETVHVSVVGFNFKVTREQHDESCSNSIIGPQTFSGSLSSGGRGPVALLSDGKLVGGAVSWLFSGFDSGFSGMVYDLTSGCKTGYSYGTPGGAFSNAEGSLAFEVNGDALDAVSPSSSELECGRICAPQSISRTQLVDGAVITLTFDGSVDVPNGNVLEHWTYHESVTLKVQIAKSDSHPRADAGGPYKAPRAGRVTLDASASHEVGRDGHITHYQWAWTPRNDCPDGTVLQAAGNARKTVTFRVLCGLDVTLEVTDSNGKSDTTTTRVGVAPRGGQFASTRVQYEDNFPGVDWRRPTDPAIAGPNGSGVVVSVNVSSCSSAKREDGPKMSGDICPFVAAGKTHRDHGYAIDKVATGPFSGDFYIKATTLSTRPRSLYNPNLFDHEAPRPKGAYENFYHAMIRLLGVESTVRFYSLARAHEGYGAPGRPRSGHTGLIQRAVQTSRGNVNRLLEPLWNDDELALQQAADKAVDDAQKFICEEARSTTSTGTATVVLWEPATSSRAGHWARFGDSFDDPHPADC